MTRSIVATRTGVKSMREKTGLRVNIYQRFRERCCATLVSLSGPHYFALSAFRRNYEGLVGHLKLANSSAVVTSYQQQQL